MTEYKLHDFIPDYLEQEDLHIQEDLTNRYEFWKLKGKISEKTPEKGKFYNHQNMFLIMLRQYDYIFNIHETGTGKTKAFINASEYLKNNSDKPGLYIKRVYVLEPGAATIEDFTNQLINTTTDPNIIYAKDRREQVRYINKFYEIKGYTEFANRAYDIYNESQIEEDFSDCLFFLDEVHAMRNYDDEYNPESQTIYDKIWNVLHTAKRIKVVLASATPMLNGPNDFISLLNLILPKDKQLPSWDLNSLDPEKLEPFIRGRITFVKNFEKNLTEEKMGTPYTVKTEISLPLEKYEIKPSIKKIIDGNIISKSSKQPKGEFKIIEEKSKIFIKSFPMTKTQEKLYFSKRKKKDAFSLFENSVSIFVFPLEEKEYKNYDASEQYNKNVEYDSNNKLVLKKTLSDYFDRPDILNMLYELSPKFHFYITEELKNSGKSFCYLENVKGSGCNILGLIMEKLGFERFSSKFSSVDSKGRLNSDMSKKKRFAIITGGINSEEERSILSLFNSFDNVDGEFLQCIIASKTGRDGINLNNTIRGYIMSPIWHEAGMYQAMSRFIRTTSHDLLLERGRVFIKIYKLASIFEQDKLDSENIKMSIDMEKYFKAESKNVIIKRYFEVLIKYAYDAYLNTERNKTNLKNPVSDEKELNKTTYHIYYISPIIEYIIDAIKNILMRRGYAFVSDIKIIAPDIDDFIFNMTILELDGKIITTNLSESKKIIVKGNSIYLTELINTNIKDLTISAYSDYLIYYKPVILENFKRTFVDKYKIIDSIKDLNMTEMKLKIQKLKDKERQDILEYYVINKNKLEKSFREKLSWFFDLYIIYLNIPEEIYDIGFRILSKEQEGRGKRREITSTRNIDVIYQKDETALSNLELKYKEMVNEIIKEDDKNYNTVFHFYDAQDEINSYTVKGLYSTKNEKSPRILQGEDFITLEKTDYKDIELTRKNLVKFLILNKAKDKRLEDYFSIYEKRAIEIMGNKAIYGSVIFREDYMSKQVRLYRVGDSSSTGQKCSSSKIEEVKDYLKNMNIVLDDDDTNKEKICHMLYKELYKRNLIMDLF